MFQKPLCISRKMQIRLKRNPIKPMIFWRPPKTNTQRYYINTSIHTYSVVARRININFNSCATHHIELLKRTRLGLEMLQNGFLETVWSEFSASAWKCFKMASWKPFGASFRPRPGNASKWLPGSRLERVFGLGLEMLQNGFLEAV